MSETNNEEVVKKAPVEDFYEVEEILDKRLTSNGLMYQIKWKNFPNEKDYTWEPIHHLVEVEDLVQQFNKIFDEKKKAARKEKKEEITNRKKKAPHGLKRNSSQQSELDRSLHKESSSQSKEKGRKTINSNKKQDDSQKISYESRLSEQDSPIYQNSRSKIFNNFAAFSNEKIAEKNISQLDQYLETNNVKLGRVHQHFLQDDCLYFHVDIVRDNQIYARTFMKYQELVQSHHDELVSYMQSWTIHQLNNKALSQTDQVKETIEYWREKM